jgi:pyruvate dehydrogenase (quinone)
MSVTVGDFLLQRLSDWGVSRIYGYPGDGINGIVGAFERIEGVQFVQTRHEEMAAFMACAHAKFSGEVGVCLATSGPGAIHLLNGLYDAKADHQPVVAIVGQQSRMALGGDYQQEVDLMSLFKDVAHEYVHTVTTPEQVRHLVDRAFRIARDQRTVTCLIFPNDVQALPFKEPPRAHGTVHTGIGYTAPAGGVPADSDLQRAAEVLNAGSKLAILVGAGALHATDEVIEVAELLGAGVAKALLGKAAVPDDLPFVTGAIGLLGTKASWDLMTECDTLLMIGSAFPYSEFLPKEGAARGVQIDIDGRMLNLRYPMEVGLIGDSRKTLAALIPHLQRKQDRSWRERVERNVARWWQVLEARAMNPGEPINPQRAFRELSPRLPDNCILTCDSGSSASWYARDLKMRRGMMGSLSGGLATMGPALPYAIAAKFAHPERHVIAIAGDGAMQMNGINGLITLAKVWKAMGQSAPDRGRAEQPRSEHGDLGRAGAGRRSEVQGCAGAAGFSLCALCGHAGLARHTRRPAGTDRRGLGSGAGVRCADLGGIDHRSQYTAIAAACIGRADEGFCVSTVASRSGFRGDHPRLDARSLGWPVSRRAER